MEKSPQETSQQTQAYEPVEVAYTIPIDTQNLDTSWQDHEWFADVEQDVSIDKDSEHTLYQPGESNYEAYLRKKALNENTRKQIGAYALFIPGAPQAVNMYKEVAFDHKYQRAQRKAYINEHGTLVSNTKKHVVKTAERIRSLQAERSAL